LSIPRPDPLIVLGRGLVIESASRALFQTFKVGRDETIGRQLYELGEGQSDIPELRLLLEDVIPKSTAVMTKRWTSDFPGIGRRRMLMTARRLHDHDNVSRTLQGNSVRACHLARKITTLLGAANSFGMVDFRLPLSFSAQRETRPPKKSFVERIRPQNTAYRDELQVLPRLARLLIPKRPEGSAVIRVDCDLDTEFGQVLLQDLRG
jgi:hypothetical protein